MLQKFQVLKLYAWEVSFLRAVENVRAKELKHIKSLSLANAYIFCVFNMVPVLVTIASFAAFVLIDDRNKITPNTVFVAVALFNMLRMPMIELPSVLAQVMQAWVSLIRINKYLNSPDLNANLVTHETSGKLLNLLNL